MTSTSAGSGASSGDGGDGTGESWGGWFTRSKPQSRATSEAGPAEGAPSDPADTPEQPAQSGQSDRPDDMQSPEGTEPAEAPEARPQRSGVAARFASGAESGRAGSGSGPGSGSGSAQSRGGRETGLRGPSSIPPVDNATDRARHTTPTDRTAPAATTGVTGTTATTTGPAEPASPADTGVTGPTGADPAHEHPAADYVPGVPLPPDPPDPSDTDRPTAPSDAERTERTAAPEDDAPTEAAPQPTGAADPPAPAGPPTPPLSAVETSREATLTRRTLAEIEPQADAVTAYFYALLFLEHPELRELFPASMNAQRDRFFRGMLTAIRLSDDEELLRRYLSGLGRGHRKYGTLPEHFPAVGECLLTAIAQHAPESWDEETEAAWANAYTRISQIMIDAAAQDAQHAPAWWNAEIVTHERRTSEIAVISVRPDGPYPFRAGQYASIETPWWPRVWRHYSFASAPRPDGLLTFHVKAVSAGWVSSALVHRAQPGDVLRLGPPEGAMTLDHRTGSGLVCVGGGTGIAPVKALVEDVAQQGSRRPVEVFYGARSGPDLYDLETMLKLEQQYAWLSLRPVVATGPGPAHPDAVVGRLPDALRQYGPWRQACEGFLSGPPGMIRSALDALVASGIPAQRVRHDAVQELVDRGD